jgi:hypothetical protein
MDKLSSIFAAREDMSRAMVKLEQVFSSGTIDKEVRRGHVVPLRCGSRCGCRASHMVPKSKR